MEKCCLIFIFESVLCYFVLFLLIIVVVDVLCVIVEWIIYVIYRWFLLRIDWIKIIKCKIIEKCNFKLWK